MAAAVGNPSGKLGSKLLEMATRVRQASALNVLAREEGAKPWQDRSIAMKTYFDILKTQGIPASNKFAQSFKSVGAAVGKVDTHFRNLNVGISGALKNSKDFSKVNDLLTSNYVDLESAISTTYTALHKAQQSGKELEASQYGKELTHLGELQEAMGALQDVGKELQEAIDSHDVAKIKSARIEFDELQKVIELMSKQNLTFKASVMASQKEIKKWGDLTKTAKERAKDWWMTNIKLAAGLYMMWDAAKKMNEQSRTMINLALDSGTSSKKASMGLWEWNGALTAARINAAKMGVSIDDLNQSISEMERMRTLMFTTGQEKQLLDYAAKMAHLARVLRVDVTTAVTYATTAVNTFGESSAVAAGDLTHVVNVGRQINKEMGLGAIHMGDFTELLTEAAQNSDAYTFSARLLTNVLGKQFEMVRQSGRTYNQSLKDVKNLRGALQNAPEWIKWKAGRDLGEQLVSPKSEELLKKLPVHLQKQALELRNLRKSGEIDSYSYSRAVEQLLGQTSVGMEETRKHLMEIVKMPGSVAILAGEFNITQLEAVKLRNTLVDIDKAGSLERWGDSMDQLSKLTEEEQKELVDLEAQLHKARKAQEGMEVGSKKWAQNQMKIAEMEAKANTYTSKGIDLVKMQQREGMRAQQEALQLEAAKIGLQIESGKLNEVDLKTAKDRRNELEKQSAAIADQMAVIAKPPDAPTTLLDKVMESFSAIKEDPRMQALIGAGIAAGAAATQVAHIAAMAGHSAAMSAHSASMLTGGAGGAGGLLGGAKAVSKIAGKVALPAMAIAGLAATGVAGYHAVDWLKSEASLSKTKKESAARTEEGLRRMKEKFHGTEYQQMMESGPSFTPLPSEHTPIMIPESSQQQAEAHATAGSVSSAGAQAGMEMNLKGVDSQGTMYFEGKMSAPGGAAAMLYSVGKQVANNTGKK